MLPDLRPGGGQYHVLRHISGMDPGRFQHTVCYLGPPHDLLPTFQAEGFNPVYLRHRPGPASLLTVLSLVRLIRSQHIDLIHANTRTDRLPAEVAGLVCGVPVVTTLRSPLSARFYRTPSWATRRPPRRLKALLRSNIERWLHSRSVEHVIAISQSIRNQWLDTCRHFGLPVGNVSVVYPGINLEPFAQSSDQVALDELRNELGLHRKWPILLNVAHLLPDKGHKWLIRMMPLVLDRFPGAVLLVAGEGNERQRLEALIHSAGLGDSILLLGKRHDVPHLHALSDLFLFPSFVEGSRIAEAFGVAVLEALAAGKPIVAFDLEPFDEFLQDGVTGFLVEPGNPESLAEAVIRIVENPTLAQTMSDNARRVALERFESSRAASTLAGVYLAVLQGTSASRSVASELDRQAAS